MISTERSRSLRAKGEFGFAMFQLHFVPGLFRRAAALAYAPIGEIIPSDTGAFSMGVRRPVGVVGAIAPWNAALILSARSIEIKATDSLTISGARVAVKASGDLSATGSPIKLN